jgi:hypothetical protein
MTTACCSPCSCSRSRTAEPCNRRYLLGIWVASLLLLAAPLRAAEPAHWPTPVLGLYAVPADACSLVAALGFTVIQSYDFESDAPADAEAWLRRARPYLEAASRAKLQVLLGVPRNWLRGQMDGPVRTAVRALREHPALLAWYEDEIAESGNLDAVRFYTGIIAAEDPVHGVVLEEGNDLPALRPWGRVRMFTYYPVTAQARDAGHLKTLPERFPVANLTQPFWPALQAYGRDLVRGYPKRDLVAPLGKELQFTLCSALQSGAQGLFFYTYTHSTVYDAARLARKQWPYVEPQPLSAVSPSLWAAVLHAASDARILLPLLATATASTAVRWQADPAMQIAQWSTAGGTLVIVANPNYRPGTVRLSSATGRSMAERLDSGTWQPLPTDGAWITVPIAGPGGECILVRAAAGLR